uniref:Uncharacterized protein n=1 Tax=Romanomermis culicivorax TaxID=13658 RepID=A0A915KVM1_ROMCU
MITGAIIVRVYRRRMMMSMIYEIAAWMLENHSFGYQEPMEWLKYYFLLIEWILVDDNEMETIFTTFITTLRAAYEAYAPFLTTINVDVLASTFWEEALINFKLWYKSQHWELHLARMKPFWGFMKVEEEEEEEEEEEA